MSRQGNFDDGASEHLDPAHFGIDPDEARKMYPRALAGHIYDSVSGILGEPPPKMSVKEVRAGAREYDQITTERWSNANGAGRYRAKFTSPDGRKMSASVPHDHTIGGLLHPIAQHEAAAHNMARKLGLGPEDVVHIGEREGGGHVFQVRKAR